MNGKIIMIVFVAVLFVFCLVLALDLKSYIRAVPARTKGRANKKDTAKSMVDKAKKAIGKTGSTMPVFAPIVYMKCPGAEKYKKVPVTKDQMSIGRGEDNDIILSDPAVSEHHGMISKIRDQEGFFYAYRNLSKTNPTEFLNQEEGKYEWLGYREQVCLGEKEGMYLGDTKLVIVSPVVGHQTNEKDLDVQNVESKNGKENQERAEPGTRPASGRRLERDDVFKCL